MKFYCNFTTVQILVSTNCNYLFNVGHSDSHHKIFSLIFLTFELIIKTLYIIICHRNCIVPCGIVSKNGMIHATFYRMKTNNYFPSLIVHCMEGEINSLFFVLYFFRLSELSRPAFLSSYYSKSFYRKAGVC